MIQIKGINFFLNKMLNLNGAGIVKVPNNCGFNRNLSSKRTMAYIKSIYTFVLKLLFCS